MDVDWAAVKKAEKVDCLIGYPHWGFEQSYTPARPAGPPVFLVRVH